MEAIGNHFVLVRELDLTDASLPDFAIRACAHRFGIGSDGLLTVCMDAQSRLVYRMFNPDGTEDFCGNGLRCVARYAHDRKWVGDRFTIVHGGAEIPTEVSGATISTLLERASYEPARVPARFSGPNGSFDVEVVTAQGDVVRGSALTTGSTHFVVVSPVFDETFARISPLLEHDPHFPERTSVIWATESGPSDLNIRIWERGVGETFGCGTGSAAAAVEHMRRRHAGGSVAVHNRGGTVVVSAKAYDQPITITGNANEVYAGQFPLS